MLLLSVIVIIMPQRLVHRQYLKERMEEKADVQFLSCENLVKNTNNKAG